MSPHFQLQVNPRTALAATLLTVQSGMECKVTRSASDIEMEITLKKRPRTNQLQIRLDARNVEMLYQPSLACRNRDGSSWEPSPLGGSRRRPAAANQSVAFYEKNGPKFMHLYRPQPYDHAGHRIWAEAGLRGNLWTITLPWEFLNTAVYPIHHAAGATFGYTTQGASDDNFSNNFLWFKATSTPSDGTLNSVTVNGRIKSGSPQQVPAIYSDSSGPSSRLAYVTVATGGTAYGASNADTTTNLTYGGLANGTQYWLGSQVNAGGIIDAFFKFDDQGATTELYYAGYTNNTAVDWPATATGLTGVTHERATIYGTYTASAATLMAQGLM